MAITHATGESSARVVILLGGTEQRGWISRWTTDVIFRVERSGLAEVRMSSVAVSVA